MFSRLSFRNEFTITGSTDNRNYCPELIYFHQFLFQNIHHPLSVLHVSPLVFVIHDKSNKNLLKIITNKIIQP